MSVNYDELEKDLPFKTFVGASDHIRVNVLTNLSNYRYVLALKRLRTRIKNDELSGYDDTTPGCKNNECSWGLCQENKKLWPSPEDYIWPHEADRVAPLRRTKEQMCPLEWPHEGPGWKGCFYRCLFFSKKKKNPTRKEALKLLDILIIRFD